MPNTNTNTNVPTRPWLFKNNVPLSLPLDLLPLFIQYGRHHPEEGSAGRPRLGRRGSRQGCEDVSPGLSLPVGVADTAAATPHHIVVPQPGLRVDRLANSAENLQAGDVVTFHLENK